MPGSPRLGAPSVFPDSVALTSMGGWDYKSMKVKAKDFSTAESYLRALVEKKIKEED